MNLLICNALVYQIYRRINMKEREFRLTEKERELTVHALSRVIINLEEFHKKHPRQCNLEDWEELKDLRNKFKKEN